MHTPEHLPSVPDFSQLSAYEKWAAENWLHQPGTDKAQLHARAKLDEEIIEFSEALEAAVPEDIISEGGDILWTSAASSSNAGISVSGSLVETFPEIFPSDNISTHDIDEVALKLYSDTPLDETQNELKRYGYTLSKASKQWFRLGPLLPEDSQPRNFAEAIITTKRHRAVNALANLTLLTSYAAQTFASSNIQTMMTQNYQKIEGRIQSGTAVTKPPRV